MSGFPSLKSRVLYISTLRPPREERDVEMWETASQVLSFRSDWWTWNIISYWKICKSIQVETGVLREETELIEELHHPAGSRRWLLPPMTKYQRLSLRDYSVHVWKVIWNTHTRPLTPNSSFPRWKQAPGSPGSRGVHVREDAVISGWLQKPVSQLRKWLRNVISLDRLWAGSRGSSLCFGLPRRAEIRPESNWEQRSPHLCTPASPPPPPAPGLLI